MEPIHHPVPGMEGWSAVSMKPHGVSDTLFMVTHLVYHTAAESGHSMKDKHMLNAYLHLWSLLHGNQLYPWLVCRWVGQDLDAVASEWKEELSKVAEEQGVNNKRRAPKPWITYDPWGQIGWVGECWPAFLSGSMWVDDLISGGPGWLCPTRSPPGGTYKEALAAEREICTVRNMTWNNYHTSRQPLTKAANNSPTHRAKVCRRKLAQKRKNSQEPLRAAWRQCLWVLLRCNFCLDWLINTDGPWWAATNSSHTAIFANFHSEI